MPVRFATVREAQIISDTLLIRLEVSYYPNLNDWPSEPAQVLERGIRLSADANHDDRAVFVSDSFLGVQGSQQPVDVAWGEVAERLGTLPSLEASVFTRLSVLVRGRSGSEEPLKLESGMAKLVAGQQLILRSWFDSEVIKENRTLAVSANDEVLTASSDANYRLTSRYDRVDFWFEAVRRRHKARTIVRMDIDGSSGDGEVGDFGTHVEIPVQTRPSRLTRSLVFLFATTGAFLIAAPGLLADGDPTALKLALAAAGAVFLALATSFSPGSD